MDKKVKSLDITILLSLMLYIACIAFIVMGIIFLNKEGAGFELGFDLSSTNVKDQNIAIASIIFVTGIAFGVIGILSGVAAGVVYMITDWGDEDLNKQAKILGGLNIIPLFLSIPGNILTKKLIKEWVHDGDRPNKKAKKSKEEEKPDFFKDVKPNTGVQPAAQQTARPAQQGFGQAQQSYGYGQPQQSYGFGPQPQQSFGFGPQQPAQTRFVAPVNQSFQYAGR